MPTLRAQEGVLRICVDCKTLKSNHWCRVRGADGAFLDGQMRCNSCHNRARARNRPAAEAPTQEEEEEEEQEQEEAAAGIAAIAAAAMMASESL